MNKSELINISVELTLLLAEEKQKNGSNKYFYMVKMSRREKKV